MMFNVTIATTATVHKIHIQSLLLCLIYPNESTHKTIQPIAFATLSSLPVIVAETPHFPKMYAMVSATPQMITAQNDKMFKM